MNYYVTWICSNCREEFNQKTYSHPVHDFRCDGSCKLCPVECGPVEEIMIQEVVNDQIH